MAIITPESRAEFDRLAYPVSAQSRVIPEGRSEAALIVQQFLNANDNRGKPLAEDGFNGGKTQTPPTRKRTACDRRGM